MYNFDYLLTISEIKKKYGLDDLEQGLDKVNDSQRLKENGPNKLKNKKTPKWKFGWLPVKWTWKYNKIFRELFANFVANSSFDFHCLNLIGVFLRCEKQRTFHTSKKYDYYAAIKSCW